MQRTCPNCWTVFRITADQFRQNRGMVICGLCQIDFNASEYLLPEKAKTYEINNIDSIQALESNQNLSDNGSDGLIINQPIESQAQVTKIKDKTEVFLDPINKILHISSDKRLDKTLNIDDLQTKQTNIKSIDKALYMWVRGLVSAGLIIILIMLLWIQLTIIFDNFS